MTKPTKWLCAQRRLRSAWASAQSDQSLRCAKLSSCGQRRLWSDWADAQADLYLRWVHSHFIGFVMSRLNYDVFGVTLGRLFVLHDVKTVESHISHQSGWIRMRRSLFSPHMSSIGPLHMTKERSAFIQGNKMKLVWNGVMSEHLKYQTDACKILSFCMRHWSISFKNAFTY